MVGVVASLSVVAACADTISSAPPLPIDPPTTSAPTTPIRPTDPPNTTPSTTAPVDTDTSAASLHPSNIGRIADSGFRPTDHGFPFENYGNVLRDGTRPINMTSEELRRMFGDDVCADPATGRCDLIPEARAWLEATNKEMAGGHCYGFSVAAQLLWQRQLDPGKFGATDVRKLAISNNQLLQRSIAYDWAMQLLDSVRSKEVTGSPTKILNTLRAALVPNPPETYTIAIFKPDWSGGHAVTPYSVEDKGDGKFDVLIYDNNWPGTTRAINFDTKADTWTYNAAINPNAPNELYKGNASTKTIS